MYINHQTSKYIILLNNIISCSRCDSNDNIEVKLGRASYVLEHFIQQDTTDLYRSNYSVRISLDVSLRKDTYFRSKCKFVQARVPWEREIPGHLVPT